MRRYMVGDFHDDLDCFTAHCVFSDAKPRIPLGEWRHVHVMISAQDQVALQGLGDGFQESPGDFGAFVLMIPNIERGMWRTLPVSWAVAGGIDAAWWDKVWRKHLGRNPPRFGGGPLCIMGLGDVRKPDVGTRV